MIWQLPFLVISDLRESKAEATMSFITWPRSHTPSFLKYPTDDRAHPYLMEDCTEYTNREVTILKVTLPYRLLKILNITFKLESE